MWCYADATACFLWFNTLTKTGFLSEGPTALLLCAVCILVRPQTLGISIDVSCFKLFPPHVCSTTGCLRWLGTVPFHLTPCAFKPTRLTPHWMQLCVWKWLIWIQFKQFLICVRSVFKMKIRVMCRSQSQLSKAQSKEVPVIFPFFARVAGGDLSALYRSCIH